MFFLLLLRLIPPAPIGQVMLQIRYTATAPTAFNAINRVWRTIAILPVLLGAKECLSFSIGGALLEHFFALVLRRVFTLAMRADPSHELTLMPPVRAQ